MTFFSSISCFVDQIFLWYECYSNIKNKDCCFWEVCHLWQIFVSPRICLDFLLINQNSVTTFTRNKYVYSENFLHSMEEQIDYKKKQGSNKLGLFLTCFLGVEQLGTWTTECLCLENQNIIIGSSFILRIVTN